MSGANQTGSTLTTAALTGTGTALKKGDIIAVPNDPTNGARALRLLEAHGLIKLKPGELVTARDVVENPKGLKIMELEAAQLPRTLQDVTASVINTNFAVEAGLVPSKDAIVIEGKDSPYANILVVRGADKDSPMAKALIKAVNSPEVKAYITKELEPKGIVGLAYWDNGFKEMSANRPLREVKDFKGLKMRIQSSKILEAQMRALGALPQVMAFSEVYQALQTGVVDGTENPHSNMYTQKMHEVQKHLTVTDHGYLGYAVIANKKFWDGLPADVRGNLETAMKEATTYANKIAQEENDKSLEAIKKSGKTQVYVPTKDEKLAFKKALVPVHQKMEGRIGRDLIQSIYKETGFDPAKL